MPLAGGRHALTSTADVRKKFAIKMWFLVFFQLLTVSFFTFAGILWLPNKFKGEVPGLCMWFGVFVALGAVITALYILQAMSPWNYVLYFISIPLSGVFWACSKFVILSEVLFHTYMVVALSLFWISLFWLLGMVDWLGIKIGNFSYNLSGGERKYGSKPKMLNSTSSLGKGPKSQKEHKLVVRTGSSASMLSVQIGAVGDSIGKRLELLKDDAHGFQKELLELKRNGLYASILLLNLLAWLLSTGIDVLMTNRMRKTMIDAKWWDKPEACALIGCTLGLILSLWINSTCVRNVLKADVDQYMSTMISINVDLVGSVIAMVPLSIVTMIGGEEAESPEDAGVDGIANADAVDLGGVTKNDRDVTTPTTPIASPMSPVHV